MRINKLMLAASAATFSLFSCINNDYDLSDIDTTVGVNANVTIPVQMDEITLHSVLDLEEGSQIKEFNDEYAVIEDGTFESDKINIPSFVIKKPVVESIDDEIHPTFHYKDEVAGNWELNGSIPADERLLSFDLSETGRTDIHFSTDDVDESLVRIDAINFCAENTGDEKPVKLKIVLNFLGIEQFVGGFSVENLKLQLPKRLQFTNLTDGAKYDANTGELEYPSHLESEGNRKEITLDLVGIIDSVKEEDGPKILVLKKNEETGKQEFTFTSVCRVIEGSAVVYGKNLEDHVSLSDLENIQSINYKCDITFNGDIDVKGFSGQIQYEVEGINVDPVSMKDIPDVLDQTGTNIALHNPQIYIQLNNPLYKDYNVDATTSLELVSHREGEQDSIFRSSKITVNATENKFCLSPTDPGEGSYYNNSNDSGNDLIEINFEGSTYVDFANLGNVLSGNKLPESIDINVVDPKIPLQTVKNFRLGEDIDPVKGTYVFYAPLALTDESKIVYTDTIDGWNDEDVDAIIINELTLNADVKSDVPLELNLEAFPIDKEGEKIDNVKGTAEIPANADNEPIIVKIEGKIEHLDGIILKATVNVAGGNAKSLKPGQHIGLTNLKVKVSGSYIKEL